jgi:membrane-associated protease RseP (regulator of RpoE activity)
MRKTSCALLLLVGLPFVGSVFGQNKAQQPSVLQHASTVFKGPLKNKDVLDMVNVGLGADVIIAKIKSSPCDFDTSPAALEELRRTNVPNEIILTMVRAPAAGDSTDGKAQPSQTPKEPLERPRSYLGMSAINAAAPAHGVLVKRVATAGPAARAGIQEGDIIEAIDGQSVESLKDYAKKFSLIDSGTQVSLTILREHQRVELSATTAPASPELVTAVKAIAYRSLPYYSKTVYQISPGSSSTTCNGTTYGNIDATAQPNYGGGGNISGTLNGTTSTNCNTISQPPRYGQINWRIVYNYNLVEGGGYRFVILCRANVRWSKCSRLVPGSVFAAAVEGNRMWITAYRNGNPKKAERVKYEVVQVAPGR